MKTVQEILDETGCEIIWNHSKAKGLYIEKANCIYLSLDYDETETKSFLYHECWHLLSKDTKAQYKVIELKQESKANDFMVESCIEEIAPDYEDCPYLFTPSEVIARCQLPEILYDRIYRAIENYFVIHGWSVEAL
jgi:hypothetical protein